MGFGLSVNSIRLTGFVFGSGPTHSLEGIPTFGVETLAEGGADDGIIRKI